MPAKLTQQQYIDKAQAIHGDKYDYSETEYLGSAQHLTVRCKKHGLFYPLANDHTSKKTGCPKCSGIARLTQEEFLQRSRELWGSKYDYSEAVYKNTSSYLTLTCDQGHRFKQLAASHLNGYNCPKCSGLARKTTEEFIADSKRLFGYKFDYSKVDYKNSVTQVTLICPFKGEFEIKPVSHLNSSTGYSSEIVNAPASFEAFEAKSRSIHGDTYDYSKSIYQSNKKSVDIVCKTHGIFSMLVHNHYRGAGCPKCAATITESKPERLLKEALIEFNPVKTRDILAGGKELDIYFEHSRVAVEVNGIYWHSDKVEPNKSAHLNKFLGCADKDIRLLQFTDKDVLRKMPVVESMIKNALGKSNRIYARNTEVRKVNHKVYSEFFESNHISGSVSAKYGYGLYFGDELVSCMSFNAPRFSNESEWEIIRFASKLGISVIGGASKLFKAFVNEVNPISVLSYADLRFGVGKVYKQLGFNLLRRTDIGYNYHHANGIVLSRQKAQKHKLPDLLGDKFDPEKSANENMNRSGYLKLYDCGHNVYLWNKP